MKWEKVKLGDIATFSNGINFNKTAYAKGIKLIGVSNFGDRFYPDYSQLQEVKKDIVRLEDCLRNGDIVFVRSNGNKELVGRCMLVKNPTERVTYSGFCIRARLNDTDRYDPVYFTYYFKSKAFRRAVSGTAVGANIQNLSQARLSNHECRIPSIEVQHRIADILSVYDDLIENNQKQIKLLEEAAQRLYKEWFVDLRFPGHENTKIVDGVPEGWSKRTVFEVSAILRRGISPKYNENARGIVINQKCIRQTIVSYDEARTQEKKYPAELEMMESDIVICSTGAGTLGRVGQIFEAKGNATLDSHVTLIRANEKIGQQSLFWSLKMQQDYLMNAGKGSTNQLELSRETIGNCKILIPEQKIAEQAEKNFVAIHNKMKECSMQIARLREARDLLLPNLMSGEVEV